MTKFGFKATVFLMSSASLLALPQAASAQSQTSPADDGNASLSSDIIVTASKRETRLSDTPIAVSVLTQAQLDVSPVTNLFDLTKKTPGVNFNDIGERSGSATVSIRGFGNNLNSNTLRVGILVDDVPQTGLRGLTTGFFDVDQIEVLKGPQSSLYGLTSEAGVIKITSRKPGNQFSGKASLDFSNIEQRANLSISGPLIDDKLSVGVSGFYSNLSGFLRSAVTGKIFDKGKAFGIRAQAVFKPTPEFEAHLIYSHNEVVDDFGSSRIPVSQTVYNAYLASNGFSERVGKFEYANDYDGKASTDQNQLSLRMSYDLGFITLTSITAYQDTKTYDSFDPSNDPGPLFGFFQSGENGSKSDDFYQEIRLASKSDTRLTYVIGGSYFRRNESQLTTVDQGAPSPFNPLLSGRSKQVDRGVFGEATYKIDDFVRITGGLRYAWSTSSALNTGGSFTPPAVVNVPASLNSSALLGKLSVDYRPREGVLVYATAARAWLPGGSNVFVDSLDGFFYKPERSWNYEVGFKLQLLDRKVVINGAVYQTDVSDYQEYVRTGILTSFQSNADEVRIRGAELEVNASVTDFIILRGQIAYNEGTYRKFADGTGNKAGNWIPGLPRWNWVTGADFGRSTGAYASAEAIHAGKYYPTGDTANAFPLDSAYTIINLKAGWRTKAWDLLGYVNNLGDERYFIQKIDTTGGGPAPSNPVFGAPGRSREFGIRGVFRF